MLRRLFPNVYEGWLVVASFAAVVVMIGTAFFYGFGTIFTPVIEEFGWSHAATSFAFSLRSEVGGIAAPVVGLLIDRFGPRRALGAGIVVSVLGVLGMSFMHNIWQFYLAMFVIALGVSASGGPVGMAATATWFERRRSRALAVLTIGGGVSGLGVVAVAWLVEAAGWRDALRVLAAVLLVVGMLATANVRGRPADHPQPMDGVPDDDSPDAAPREPLWGVPIREVLRSRSFLGVALGQAAVNFGTTSVIVHIIPFMESEGISKTAAASTVTVYTFISLIGRLGFGYLADHIDKRLILAISSAMVAVSIPLLAIVHSVPATITVMLVMAPGFGGTIPVRPAILADYFGTRYFGTVNGAMVFVMTIGAFFGPLLVGRVVDVTGEYTLGWLLCGGVTALAVPLMLSARPPHRLIARYRMEAN